MAGDVHENDVGLGPVLLLRSQNDGVDQSVRQTQVRAELGCSVGEHHPGSDAGQVFAATWGFLAGALPLMTLTGKPGYGGGSGDLSEGT